MKANLSSTRPFEPRTKDRVGQSGAVKRLVGVYVNVVAA